ncbi:non-lysosomal glucosylceramidase-like [Hyperolius riggenbachi]|uniref:non-lysosomal glucosylceramidase-like n=1 Tax=Hyperolius riggenbachi TaxID=752182 RepID=UPI0035A348B4
MTLVFQDSSLPLAVFVWDVENCGDEEVEVTIMFTMRNGSGTKTDRAGGHWNEPFCHQGGEEETTSGVLLHHCTAINPFTLGIAVRHTPGSRASHCTEFDPCGMGQEIWRDLLEDGHLDSKPGRSSPTGKGRKVAAAVAAGGAVPAGGRRGLEFSLCWDMPRVRFGSKQREYCRRYTRFFGSQEDAAVALCHYGLSHYEEWERMIEAWQDPILTNTLLPTWYKSALFNELYFMADGGTVWLEVSDDACSSDCLLQIGQKELPGMKSLLQEYGRFAYLGRFLLA